jgi:adsorption protein A
MKVVSLLLALALGAPFAVSAQQFDLGDDIDGHRRFLIYPHLQKGWESMQRGDRDRALAELERARSLAPESAAVALQLAEGYRRFGLTARAESLLRGQLTRTPSDARLRSALIDLLAAAQGASATHPKGDASSQYPPSVAALPPVIRPTQASAQAPRPPQKTVPLAGELAATVVARTASASASAASVIMGRIPTEKAPADPGQQFSFALQARRFDDAERQAALLLAYRVNNATVLDEVTYQLAQAGGVEHATRLLLQSYPFAGGTPAERERLLQRLTVVLDQQRSSFGDDAVAPLRTPLDTPWLRGYQAAFWALRQDCEAVTEILGDLAPEYQHDDLVRLGDCQRADAPASALQAYTRAHQLQPGGAGSRALANLTHAAGDYRTALGAWRSVGVERLSDDELLAAASTALAGGEREQATTWLTTYRKRPGTLEYRYWSLVARSHMGRDDPAAATALERAVQFHAETADYVLLARLQSELSRRVYWLERAVALDKHNPHAQLELGYAYGLSGRTADARRALERAAELDPHNASLQMELGYHHWRAGRLPEARVAFERAWLADQGNVAVAEQLVYVHQRLGSNQQARKYAERVLDALDTLDTTLDLSNNTTAAAAATTADRRFDLKRLHEDLGRRLTVSLDGWSGPVVGTGTSASQAGNSYSSYSQLEVDFRLGKRPVRDGKALSAYARIIGDGGEQRSALPSQNAVLGMGLRWKPLRSQVFYLAGEHQSSLEDEHRRDFLLRASASFLNGGRHGDDWHASGQGWFAHNLYVDAAHYVDADRSAFTADYRASYHGKAASSQSMEPYAHVQVNGVNTASFQRDIRGGGGVRWNLWYGANRYDAARHKLSLGVEFQRAFDTYLPHRHAVFMSLGTRW